MRWNLWKFVPIVLVSLGVATPGTAAEMAPPKVGQTTHFKCSGPYGENNSYTIATVKDGIVRIEINRDGKPEWTEKPLAARGLNLSTRRQRNDGKGIRKQNLDDDLLAKYAKLQPGSEFKFNVRERHDQAKWEWGYKVAVGQPKTIKHDLLGEIEVLRVSEKRQVWKGSYSSESDIVLYPELGVAIAWVYKDKEGTMDCALAGID